MPLKYPKKSTGAFTLIELVLVLTILALLSVVAAVKLLDMPPLRLDMAARKVQADIRYAQSLAAGTQKWTRISFSATGDNYTLYVDGTGASPGAWTILTDPLTRQDFTVQLNSADFTGVDITLVQFNQPDNDLVFDKRGNPYGYDGATATALGSSGRVRLSASSGTKDVRVARGTGRVYLE